VLTILSLGNAVLAQNQDTGTMLKNGSFESGPKVGPVGFAVLKKGTDVLPGWKVTKGTIDYAKKDLFAIVDGNFCIDVDGTPGPGAISQTIATVPGTTYIVEFLLSGNANDPAVRRLRVKAAGQSQDFSHDVRGSDNANLMEWDKQQFRFTAKAPLTIIEFESLSSSGCLYGPLLDAVFVTPLGLPGLEPALARSAQWHVYQANWYLRRGQKDSAIDEDNKAIALNPKDPASFYTRGLLYQEALEPDKALADYDQAIKLNYSLPAVFKQRGQIFMENKQFSQALSDFEKCQQKLADDLAVWQFKAQALKGLGRYKEAVVSITKAIALSNRYNGSRLYQIRIELFIALNQYDAALADCNKALTLSKSDDVHQLRARVYEHQGKFREALKDIDEVQKDDHLGTKWYFEKARLLDLSGDHAGALRQRAEGKKVQQELQPGTILNP